jgi:hypothetical protein
MSGLLAGRGHNDVLTVSSIGFSKGLCRGRSQMREDRVTDGESGFEPIQRGEGTMRMMCRVEFDGAESND